MVLVLAACSVGVVPDVGVAVVVVMILRDLFLLFDAVDSSLRRRHGLLGDSGVEVVLVETLLRVVRVVLEHVN